MNKNISFVTIFPDVAQNSPIIPSFLCSEKSLGSILGLWPDCMLN